MEVIPHFLGLTTYVLMKVNNWNYCGIFVRFRIKLPGSYLGAEELINFQWLLEFNINPERKITLAS